MKAHVLPQPLEYRYPGTPGLGRDLIYRWLCTRHCLGVAGALLRISVGAGAIVGAAWVVSGLVAFLVGRLVSTDAGLAVGWPAFWGYLLLVAPLLIWRTVRSGGEFYAAQWIDSSLAHGRCASHGEWRYRAEVATTALYGDLLFWGPRLMIEGARRLAGREVVRSASHLARAACVLAHLLRAGEAVRTKALRFPKEPADAFQRNLRWLESHDYIGISSDGQRVWMSSHVRESLCSHLPIPQGRPRRPEPGQPQRNRYMDKPEMVDIIFRK